MRSCSVLMIVILLTIVIVVALVLTQMPKDYYKGPEVNPADFGGINKINGGSPATFIQGDYIDIRNEQGFFASTFPIGNNPFGFRLQPIANTLIYYGTDNTGVLYAPIEPGSVGAYFIMRPQGDAIILSPDGKILWSTNTTTGKVITFAEDGDIVVYDANANPVWQQTNAEFASTAFKVVL